VKCQLDLLGGLARAQSLDVDCRVGLGVRPPKVRHVLLDLIKVVLVFRWGEFFVDRASVIIKEDDSIKNVDRVVLHDDQGGSRSFDDVPIRYHQPTWGKGDDTGLCVCAREKGFQDTARLGAISAHAPALGLEKTDGRLKKRFDFRVQVEEGDSYQGGQFGSDRALAHATNAGKEDFHSRRCSSS